MTVQKRRYLFDGLTLRVTNDVTVNFKSGTRVGVSELALNHFWRSSRIKKERRMGTRAGRTEGSRARRESPRGGTAQLCWKTVAARYESQIGNPGDLVSTVTSSV